MRAQHTTVLPPTLDGLTTAIHEFAKAVAQSMSGCHPGADAKVNVSFTMDAFVTKEEQ